MCMSGLLDYLKETPSDSIKPPMVQYLASLDQVHSVFPAVAASTVRELETQRSHLKLIASENYCSLAVQAAMGNLLTDKYAETYAEVATQIAETKSELSALMDELTGSVYDRKGIEELQKLLKGE
jgi:hypothetical protein